MESLTGETSRGCTPDPSRHLIEKEQIAGLDQKEQFAFKGIMT